jgi:hypothetical protein
VVGIVAGEEGGFLGGRLLMGGVVVSGVVQGENGDCFFLLYLGW